MGTTFPVATRWVSTPNLSLDWWLIYLWAAILLLYILLFKSRETLKMKPHCLRTLENRGGQTFWKGPDKIFGFAGHTIPTTQLRTVG